MTFVTAEKGRRGNTELKTLSLPTGFITANTLTTVQYAFETVPWFHRAVDLRAQTVSRVPYHIVDDKGEEIEETPELKTLNDWMAHTLYLAELSLTLFGASYFIPEKNRFNLNVTPRYIPANSVAVQINQTSGAKSFRVNMTPQARVFAENELLWLWQPNAFSETQPGAAPAEVALRAAGLLGALDEMATQYFRAGAVPITAVKIPPSVNADERTKLQNWFQRSMTGISNAFKFLAVNKDTEFQQIGTTIKESQVPELTQAQRENVAVAIGVPPSVLDGRAANFATADSEMMGFYLHTVIPECERIAEVFNRQLLSPFGYILEFQADQLEIMQTSQLEQAKTVMELTGGKAVMSQETAMEWIGLDPEQEFERMEARKEETTTTPPPTFGASTATPASAASPAEESDAEEQMKAWRARSLFLFAGGSPVLVGAPFDNELIGASSAKMIRTVYDNHWPRKSQAMVADWQVQAIAELRRYNDLVAAKDKV